MKKYNRYFNVNQKSWDARVPMHLESEFYNVKGFNKGESTLQAFELQALGEVRGEKLLHLQCHFGLDTLSWSRKGAICTGIDLSETAIQTARKLAETNALQADFVCGNVLDTPKLVEDTFDIVFTSYGVINWLPDLTEWGQIIAAKLRHGGIFYMVEFHPICWMFDHESSIMSPVHTYSSSDVIEEVVKGSYADKTANLTGSECTWNHGLGDVVNALIDAGLQLSFLNEHYETPYPIFSDLTQISNGLFIQKPSLYPLLFEIKAIKQ
ncbi:class I SAM-dependent methyltransferase [Aquimarina sp. ERC-38]|uniref:class I SAM-dependent methyltransferase n=1 Tax=Aquimarina sp. ERC-38 TaxID=2949996 RepID=UPI002247F09B|nr:class I SAM-dependent methyltransferase [Aquimarina sp. ERC-38]UZO80519.1 class I SAM-dependent methyltransferase [Aquimarina sp. ERC-38]